MFSSVDSVISNWIRVYVLQYHFWQGLMVLTKRLTLKRNKSDENIGIIHISTNYKFKKNHWMLKRREMTQQIQFNY